MFPEVQLKGIAVWNHHILAERQPTKWNISLFHKLSVLMAY